MSKSEFAYDYASRKVISREFNYSRGRWVQTEDKRRVFDGLDVIQERNSSNYITAQLVRDGNIGGILARTTADGPAFYGYDGNGNVTLLTNSAGQDVGHYRYDAFGNTLEAVGVRAAENPYRFSTKELHGPSGLYDYGLRFYSPSMGRWINRDSIEEEGGNNLYAMLGNNAINAVDDYGLYKAPGIRFWAKMIGRGAIRSGSRLATGAAVGASLPFAIMAATLAITAKPVGDGTLKSRKTLKGFPSKPPVTAPTAAKNSSPSKPKVTPTPDPLSQMRVQLQKRRQTFETIPLAAPSEIGVGSAEVIAALYAVAGSKAIPRQSQAAAAVQLAKAIRYVRNTVSKGGMSIGGSKSFYFNDDGNDFRFDIEDIRGYNLRY